jgi:hypothetical protein
MPLQAVHMPPLTGDLARSDLTLEEHQWRGDAADALFREMKRRIAAKMRP